MSFNFFHVFPSAWPAGVVLEVRAILQSADPPVVIV
jgi:hypothetical protein